MGEIVRKREEGVAVLEDALHNLNAEGDGAIEREVIIVRFDVSACFGLLRQCFKKFL